jgi:DNA polymerase-4
MMKLICVLLPHFPLCCEVLRRPAIKDCPVVLTCASGSQKLVLDYSPGLAGLQPGMPLQQALARQGEVTLLQADVPYYRSIFNELLDALEEKSPLVEGLDLGQAYIGADGLQLIYRSDDALVNAIREAIPGAFTVQIGIAEGKFPAYLAALYSPPGGHRILDGNVAAFLGDLPCDVLPVSLKSRRKLRDFGLNTLGQVAALPAGPVQSQFGPEGKRIWELAGGYDDTPLRPRFTEETIEESTVLTSVTVSLPAILATVEVLLSRAFARGTLKGRGISSITLWTRSWDVAYWERNIPFKEPAADMVNIISRIKQVLENFPQPGPVEQVGLKLTRLGYRPGRQKSLFAEVRAKDRLLDDVKQLELRLGGPQVYRIKEVEPWSRIPERRYALTPLGR